jgi:hypothetical protein
MVSEVDWLPRSFVHGRRKTRVRIDFPDEFVGLADGGRSIVCEVKPYFQIAWHTSLETWRAALRVCRLHGYGLLVTDGNLDRTNSRLASTYRPSA